MITKKQFNDWTEGEVTREVIKYIDKWISNYGEAVQMACEVSPLETADNYERFISFIKRTRNEIKTLESIKSINYESLKSTLYDKSAMEVQGE